MKKKACLAVAALLLLAWILWANTALEVNTYTVLSDRLPAAFDGYRIAQVSDLHSAEIGENNENLLAMLREAKPDLIAITGDLIDVGDTDITVALRFAERAMEIAPCYYVTGNHEAGSSQYSKLKQGLLDLGVMVLEDQRMELERAGERINLIGVYDPSFSWQEDQAALMDEKLRGLVEEGAFTILLSHRPELFRVYAENGVDLALSGHAHGGQFRLPFIGGLIAPNQGLFPTYDAGLYTEGRTHMLVSRGIGNSVIPLRFNNRPEILLIVLRTAQE